MWNHNSQVASRYTLEETTHFERKMIFPTSMILFQPLIFQGVTIFNFQVAWMFSLKSGGTGPCPEAADLIEGSMFLKTGCWVRPKTEMWPKTYCLEYILRNSYEFLSISQFQTETPVQTRADLFLLRTLVISCDLVFWHWKRSETLVNI